MTGKEIRICYGLLDNVDKCPHQGMRQLMKDANFALDSILMPIVDADAMSMITWAADETTYTHVVIFESGTFLGNSERLRKAWYHLCEDDWLVAGHIMWKKDDQYPYLHNQTYAVNLKNWKAAGRPVFGDTTNQKMSLPSVRRSTENMHDDYTPLWLRPNGEEVTEPSKVKFGWQMIAASMGMGLPVVNLPFEIRTNKLYLYPDDKPDRLVDAIHRIRRGEHVDLSVIPDNDTQCRVLASQQWTMESNDKSAIFIFNTGDHPIDRFKTTDPGAIWTTASGFKALLEWIYRGSIPGVQMNTFDFNVKSLALWEDLNRNWTGTDLYGYLKSVHPDCDNEDLYCWGNKLDYETPREASDRQELLLHDFCGGREQFIEHWNRYRQLEHRYHAVNLVEDPESISRLMQPNLHHLVWINNIFYFNRSIRRYGIDAMQQSVRRFAVAIRDTGIGNHICGQSASAYFFDPADYLVQRLDSCPEPVYQCQLAYEHSGIRRWAGHPLIH